MRQVSVLLSCNFDADQVAAIRAAHLALVVYGEAGGYALEPATGLDTMELTYPREQPDVDVAGILREVEVLVAARLPRDIRRRAPRLKWVQYTGAGLDHLLPPDELRQASFTITNVSGIHAIPLAEVVLSMMLNFAKRSMLFEQQRRRHVWQRHLMGELSGQTLGILGLGRVGHEVARVGRCLGMRVVALRRREPPLSLSAGEPVDKLLARSQLHSLLEMSDFVVCCLPFTSETYRLLGEAEFRAMKPTAYFINIGRGQVADEAALIRALQAGWIAGAGLDVFEEEPLPTTSPLWDLPNVFILPHQGSDTDRYLDRTTALVCENLRRYAEGEPLLNVVDPVRGY